MDDVNFREPDMTDDEWAEWIERLSSESREAEEAAKARVTTHATSDDEYDRHLLEGEYLPFHNYQFLIDVKTEVCWKGLSYFQLRCTRSVFPLRRHPLTDPIHCQTHTHTQRHTDPCSTTSGTRVLLLYLRAMGPSPLTREETLRIGEC